MPYYAAQPAAWEEGLMGRLPPSRFPEARSNSDNSSIRVISIFPLQPALNCMNARAISDDHAPVAALVDPDRWMSLCSSTFKDVRLAGDGKSQGWDNLGQSQHERAPE